MANGKTSWLKYMGGLQQRSFSPDQLNLHGLERILNINQSTQAVFNHAIPWLYLLDYTSGRYLMTSKSVEIMLGYTSNYFTEGGIPLVMDLYQKDHLDLFSNDIFPDRLQLLKQIPPAEHPNHIFSYNLRVKNKHGEYLDLLQRNCFVKSDDKGNPLLSFGVITNITHYQAGDPVIQVVERIDDSGNGGMPVCISKKAYYLNGQDSVFTKREIEILKWTVEGLTHKEIAQKLYITAGTVLLHRKNMLNKSNTRNAAELVGYAFKNRLL